MPPSQQVHDGTGICVKAYWHPEMHTPTLDFKRNLAILPCECIWTWSWDHVQNFSSYRPEAKDGTEQLVEAHPRSDWQLMHHSEGTSMHSEHAAVPPENCQHMQPCQYIFQTKCILMIWRLPIRVKFHGRGLASMPTNAALHRKPSQALGVFLWEGLRIWAICTVSSFLPIHTVGSHQLSI